MRANLWLIPTATAVAAFALAKSMAAVDRHIGQASDRWFRFSGEAESARALLSTISASMITFTGLVFSITILVLQLASSQFSPRALRTFLEDRVTQVAMATFVGTFVFAMALLPELHIRHETHDGFVPGLSVSIAFALVLASVGVFIHYINHMAHSVRAVSIVKHISKETRCELLEMYPALILDSPETPREVPQNPPDFSLANEGQAGVLSSINQTALLEACLEHDLVVRLLPMPGDFVANGAPLFEAWGTTSPSHEQLAGAVLLADERTPRQDPGFGFRQLVDIATRALSPGVNDPSTAVQVLDEIHDLLRLLAERDIPSSQRVDEEGVLRLILPAMTWQGYVHLALDEIRHYGGSSLQVARRTRALLDDCLSVASPERQVCLRLQQTLLDHNIEEHMPTEHDRAAAKKASAQGHGN